MNLRNLLLATASMALTAGVPAMAQDRPASVGAMTVSGAMRGPSAPAAIASRGRNHHLLFIATPGGGGADDQSGIVVLDADHDYRFVKRISYGLPAARMPGPEISGIAAS